MVGSQTTEVTSPGVVHCFFLQLLAVDPAPRVSADMTSDVYMGRTGAVIRVLKLDSRLGSSIQAVDIAACPAI